MLIWYVMSYFTWHLSDMWNVIKQNFIWFDMKCPLSMWQELNRYRGTHYKNQASLVITHFITNLLVSIYLSCMLFIILWIWYSSTKLCCLLFALSLFNLFYFVFNCHHESFNKIGFFLFNFLIEWWSEEWTFSACTRGRSWIRKQIQQ